MEDNDNSLDFVGEFLYKLINPNSSMDIPSYFYEKLEPMYEEWDILVKSNNITSTFLRYAYNKTFNQNYKRGDIIYAVVSDSIIKTKIVEVLPDTLEIYTGDWIEKSIEFHSVDRDLDKLLSRKKVYDITRAADNFMKHRKKS